MCRHGGDRRGSSGDRAARKNWMLSPDGAALIDGEWVPFGGDGESVPCWWQCGRVVTYDTVEADRLVPGSSYRRGGIVPACRPCNLARSDDGDLTVQQIANRVQETTARHGRLVPALAV